jgi:hypothetical protein
VPHPCAFCKGGIPRALLTGPFVPLLGDGNTHPFAKNAKGWGTLGLEGDKGSLTRRSPIVSLNLSSRAKSRDLVFLLEMFICHRQKFGSSTQQ